MRKEIAGTITIYNELYLKQQMESEGNIEPHHISAMNQVFSFLHLLDRYNRRTSPQQYAARDKLNEKASQVTA